MKSNAKPSPTPTSLIPIAVVHKDQLEKISKTRKMGPHHLRWVYNYSPPMAPEVCPFLEEEVALLYVAYKDATAQQVVAGNAYALEFDPEQQRGAVERAVAQAREELQAEHAEELRKLQAQHAAKLEEMQLELDEARRTVTAAMDALGKERGHVTELQLAAEVARNDADRSKMLAQRVRDRAEGLEAEVVRVTLALHSLQRRVAPSNSFQGANHA